MTPYLTHRLTVPAVAAMVRPMQKYLPIILPIAVVVFSLGFYLAGGSLSKSCAIFALGAISGYVAGRQVSWLRWRKFGRLP